VPWIVILVGCDAGASDSMLTETARADIMCYNEDRSMTGFVSPEAKGCDPETTLLHCRFFCFAFIRLLVNTRPGNAVGLFITSI